MVISIKYICLLLFNPSVISDSMTPWTAGPQASLSFTISHSLLKLVSVAVHSVAKSWI